VSELSDSLDSCLLDLDPTRLLLSLLLHELFLLVLEHFGLPDSEGLIVVSFFKTPGVEELRRVVSPCLVYRIVLDELLNYQRVVVVSLLRDKALVEGRHRESRGELEVLAHLPLDTLPGLSLTNESLEVPLFTLK